MEKIKWSKKVTNAEVPERIGEKMLLLNNTLLGKVDWIGHIVRRIWLSHYTTEGQMAEVKSLGRRITKLLDYLRNRRRYWELKEEAEDRKRWK